jgi:hypothetical protein
MAELGSKWGNLSPHLLMSIYPVEMRTPGDTRSYQPVAGGNVVVFPIAPGGELRQTQNWISPFENITPDASMSTFSAMLQVGGFNPVLQALEKASFTPGAIKALLQSAQGEAAQLVGRTSVTRFNSTQIYSGSPPLNMSVTALFRAMDDPVKEVQKPVDQLWQWMLPRELATDLTLTGLIKGAGPLAAFYPSLSPQVVGVRFGGMAILPMVIESIGQALDAPIDKDGRPVSAQIPLQINSLAAFDVSDWRAMRR